MHTVWLDCDPGHDDAMAIIMAHYGEGVELLGISTVFGNQTLHLTTLNALKIHYVAGLPSTIPVVAGAHKPLCRPERICPEIHGEEGLDTKTASAAALFPSHEELRAYGRDHGILSSEKAVNVMARRIMESATPVTLVLTGAMTNAAVLLSMYPEVRENLAQIVCMGGSMGMGNTSPMAEWNIEIDPEAAKAVFGSGIHIVQVPLNVTHTALVTEAVVGRIQALESPFAQLIVDLLEFFTDSYKSTFGFDRPPLHDPLTIAYLMRPDIFTSKKLNVEIETGSSFCDGATVCDFYGTTGRPKNVELCLTCDIEVFWDLLVGCLSEANKNSPLQSTESNTQL